MQFLHSAKFFQILHTLYKPSEALRPARCPVRGRLRTGYPFDSLLPIRCTICNLLSHNSQVPFIASLIRNRRRHAIQIECCRDLRSMRDTCEEGRVGHYLEVAAQMQAIFELLSSGSSTQSNAFFRKDIRQPAANRRNPPCFPRWRRRPS